MEGASPAADVRNVVAADDPVADDTAAGPSAAAARSTDVTRELLTVRPAPPIPVLVLPPLVESDDRLATTFASDVHRATVRELRATTDFDLIELGTTTLDDLLPPNSPPPQINGRTVRAATERFGDAAVIQVTLRLYRGSWSIALDWAHRGSQLGVGDVLCSLNDPGPGKDADSLGRRVAAFLAERIPQTASRVVEVDRSRENAQVPPSAPPRTAAEPVPLIGNAPEYPPDALEQGLEGWVELVFTITTSGTVRDIAVVAASSPGVFDDAAQRALARWRYSLGGPVVERLNVRTRITFELPEQGQQQPQRLRCREDAEHQ